MKKLLSVSIAIFTLLYAKSQKCPGSVSVNGTSGQLIAGDTLAFTVNVSGTNASLTYNWSTSAGMILAGQGTAMIRVNTEGLGGQYVTATVELGGLPRECNSTSSGTAYIMEGPEKIVSGTFTSGQELKNAVQKFVVATEINDPSSLKTGFIYLYKNATTTESALNIFKAAIVSAFEYNKVFPHQYKIVDGGKKKLSFYEFYILEPGDKEPKPTN